MRPIRTFAILPTMFTLGNLVCGFFAIVIASRVQTPNTPQGYIAPMLSEGAAAILGSGQLHVQRVADFPGDGLRRTGRLRSAAGEGVQ